MINVEIKMISGERYRISNAVSDNLKEFIKNVLAPYGTTMAYVEIFPSMMIATDNIESIREISDEEIEAEYDEVYDEIQENNTPVESEHNEEESEKIENEEIEESKE